MIYEVRFTYYKYNTGRADNGWYQERVRFAELAQAEKYAQEVRIADSHWLDENFHIFGYVERVDGIWKVTDEKVI